MSGWNNGVEDIWKMRRGPFFGDTGVPKPPVNYILGRSLMRLTVRYHGLFGEYILLKFWTKLLRLPNTRQLPTWEIALDTFWNGLGIVFHTDNTGVNKYNRLKETRKSDGIFMIVHREKDLC